ncbi:hypothetical protein K7432_005304 [Basidiobolus ranarum]|uniref:Oxo-4-hydroxy-4-carboxy-5-ureidoimidazoline decarboxylase domain-containing protein n=1 Tax=Basidiobolus ranarum TaxID=34480 RepID=A0ABR2WWP7_9FUNG
MSTIVSVAELNQLSKEDFVQSINALFEPAPPLVELLYSARPFSSYEELLDYADEVIKSRLTPEERIEVVNAHPRIGAAAKNLSQMSLQEQGIGKELTNEEKVLERLKELNQQYEEKYGFKFVVFVNGRSRAEIIPVLEQRLNNSDKQTELEIGLTDMLLIARDRLKKLSVN